MVLKKKEGAKGLGKTLVPIILVLALFALVSSLPTILFIGLSPTNNAYTNSSVVNVSSSDSSSTYTLVDLDNSLMGWWRFEETNNTNQVVGKVNNATSFNGINQYISFPASMEGSATNVSFTFWFKANSANVDQAIFGESSTGNPNSVVRILTNKVYINLGNASGQSSPTMIDPYVAGQWYHVAIVQNRIAGITYTYVNGTNYMNATYNVSGMTQWFAGVRGITNANWFNGSIDEIRVWNRSLSAAEIVNMYNNESLGQADPNMNTSGLLMEQHMDSPNGAAYTDTGTKGNNGTSINFPIIIDSAGKNNLTVLSYSTTAGATPLASGVFGRGYNFDARLTGMLSVPGTTLITQNFNYSISAWFRVSDNSSTSVKTIYSEASAADQTVNGGFYVSNNIYFYLNNGSTIVSANAYGGVPTNTWIHAVAVRNGTNYTVYINGLPNNSTVSTFSYVWPYAIGNKRIGGYATYFNTFYFNGSIDELAMFNRSLSPSEVLALYNSTANQYYNTFSLSQGNHSLTAYAVNSAGGLNSTAINFTYDTIPPAGNLSFPNDLTYSNSQSNNLSAYVSDSYSVGNSTLSVYNSTGLVNQTTISFTPGGTSKTVGTLVSLANGTYNWSYTFLDSAGNSFSTGNNSLKVYTGVPVINFTGQTPSGGYVNSSLVAINFSSSDNIQTYSLVNFDNSLVGWWRFDNLSSSGENATRAFDWSGSNNNASIAAGTIYSSAGAFGGCYTFDPVVNKYITVTNSQSIAINGSFSVFVWIYPKSSGQYHVLSNSNYQQSGYQIYMSGGTFGGATNAGGTAFTIQGNNDVTPYLNKWTQLGMTLTPSGNLSFYINGNVTASRSANLSNGTFNLLIGARSDGAQVFNGSIDEVTLFNRSLSYSEIGALYNSTANQYYGNFSNFNLGNHSLTAYTVNLAGTMTSSRQNIIYEINPPNVTLLIPSNNSYSNSQSNNLTANISDNYAIKNATLNVYNSTGLVNQNTTSFVINTVSAVVGTVVSAVDGIYTWFYSLFDWAGNQFTTGNNTLTIDTINPLISFVDPTPLNNTGRSVSFLINATIFDTNLANITVNWNGANSVFNITNNSLTSLGNGNWIFSYIQTGLSPSASYLYFLNATDYAGNSNSTEVRLVKGNLAPIFLSIVSSPTDIDTIDPGINISITVNISKSPANLDTVFLRWKNSTQIYWEPNITMVNQTLKNNGESSLTTILNTTLYLPSYEDNITFSIWANDSAGDSSTSANYTISSFWDCTWRVIPGDLGATAGWGTNKFIGNFTIINTGDVQYSNNNCTLLYKLSNNLGDQRIYFDNDEFSTVYTLGAKTNRTVGVNASFSKSASLVQENLIIGVRDYYSRSNTSSSNLTGTLITNKQGPYLASAITSIPSSVYLSNNMSFNILAYLKNLMGDNLAVNENNTAYNVSYDWVVPDGFNITSGSLNRSYENISDLNLYSANLTLGFSDLSSFSPGILSFVLNVQGNNLSGDPIVYSDGSSLISQSANITFLCSNVSDGVYVSACGKLDGDYVAPSTSGSVSSSSSGGGGGGGSGGGLSFQRSDATFELVRGKEQSFVLNITNKYDSLWQDINVSVSGINSEYIVLGSIFGGIGLGETYPLKVTISAPDYFSQSVYTLQFKIFYNSILNGTKLPHEDLKTVTLRILEFSRERAMGMVNESTGMFEVMNRSGFVMKEANADYGAVLDAYNETDFSTLQTKYNIFKTLYGSAIESNKTLAVMKANVEISKRQGIAVLETEKALFLAETAFQRGDYALALERLKEAQLTYALETKGEFNFIYAVKNNPIQAAGLIFALLITGTGSTLLVRYRLYKRKLKLLQEEEVLLLELMKVVQRECFEKMHMSMEEYREAMAQYESRLSDTIAEKIRIETRLANMLKIRGKKSALHEEKQRLIKLIAEAQNSYLNNGTLETRIYDNMLKSYTARLSDVEEKITFIEAQDAMGGSRFARFINRLPFIN